MATTKEERAAIDAKVLAALANKVWPVRALQVREATGLRHREVDRALQRLRKANEVTFSGGTGSGWSLVGKPKRKAAKRGGA